MDWVFIAAGTIGLILVIPIVARARQANPGPPAPPTPPTADSFAGFGLVGAAIAGLVAVGFGAAPDVSLISAVAVAVALSAIHPELLNLLGRSR